MQSLWHPSARRELIERLGRLSGDNRPAWGRMDVSRMLAHLSDSLRMALGELAVESKRLPVRYSPLKELVVYWLPFPKNVPTAPALVARSPADWAEERVACQSLIERFETEPQSRVWPEHPAFGSLTSKQWGVLGYRHIDHHLRQFGV